MKAFQLKKTLCIEPESDEELDALSVLIGALDIELNDERRREVLEELARIAIHVMSD